MGLDDEDGDSRVLMLEKRIVGSRGEKGWGGEGNLFGF